MEPNWEQLFDKRSYCPTCGLDTTFDKCDCLNELPGYDDMEDKDE